MNWAKGEVVYFYLLSLVFFEGCLVGSSCFSKARTEVEWQKGEESLLSKSPAPCAKATSIVSCGKIPKRRPLLVETKSADAWRNTVDCAKRKESHPSAYKSTTQQEKPIAAKLTSLSAKLTTICKCPIPKRNGKSIRSWRRRPPPSLAAISLPAHRPTRSSAPSTKWRNSKQRWSSRNATLQLEPRNGNSEWLSETNAMGC